MSKWKLTALLLTSVLLGACSNNEEPARVPLEAPAGLVFSQVQQTTLAVSWDPVQQAGAYGYRLLKFSPGDAVTLVKAENEIYRTHITFMELTPGTRYAFEVRARAFQDSAYSDSETKKSEIVTASEVATPWVEVVFSYMEQNGKGALHIANISNSKCAHFYSTTANVNVIGDGIDDEPTFVEYLISDYENGTPGVYRDSEEHNFNDNGAGFDAGDHLFYGVAGVDRDGIPGDLNWYWVEVPVRPGDPVLVLDAADKQLPQSLGRPAEKQS